MAAAKPKKSPPPKPVFDVARPGKSAPSATTKAIITKHPLLKDPMVVVVDAPTVPEAAGPQAAPTESPIDLPTTSRLVIKPLHDNIAPEATGKPAAEPKASETAPPEAPNVPEESIVYEEGTEKKLSPAGSSPLGQFTPNAEDAELTALKLPTATQPSPAADASGQKSPTETTPLTSDTDANNAKNPALQTEKDIDQVAKDLADHDKHIQKLIENKQYFLPINAVEKRRTKRFVVLGIILSLVLAAAWADIALDAGLININGIKPLTHFFSN